ncbi:DUF1015 domain-containing protein [Abyssisolibacter fermentans]|uniref:DUF1015 domain-containing protein n=1 Tax=Abyssisolibacter fermentans TaxID=1766203 RepID=UPI00083645AA|nr:DUF1015 family protein [Abyssisolibacter fermentans]
MTVFKPFKALRPVEEFANKVASLPYDVMNRQEAKKMAFSNDKSFLHVVRSEIDLDDDISPYDNRVYQKAKENLNKFINEGFLKRDKQKCFYIYRQEMNGKIQTGLVGCAGVDDYLNNKIKKHEHTRPSKEIDRINNFDYCNANTAPIFLTYRKNKEVSNIIQSWMDNNRPVYDFISDDEIKHIVWVIDNKEIIESLINIFKKIEYLYIADGHHRSASAIKVALKRRKRNTNYNGNEEFNYFLSVAFPDEDLYIMDYNRVVKDLNGLTSDEFIEKIKEKFEVRPYEGQGCYKPNKKHEFGMYLDNKWYSLIAKENTFNKNDEVSSLDASILQDNLLKPILGIDDPRTNERIDFIGGIRGLEELETRVENDMKVAFSMYPTTIEDLLKVADADKIMPPKSTWFEPKLRSGLFVHELD